ncbi:MAG: hypothetical protein JWN54_2367 [Mycobacterium sp.]|jgi:hypothetical protein|nr:hypothetical protein [Mycobacterium sp.]
MKRHVWTKAARSGNDGQCVEVRDLGDVIEVRDSKDRGGPVLRYTAGEWDAFLDGARNGEFDR